LSETRSDIVGGLPISSKSSPSYGVTACQTERPLLGKNAERKINQGVWQAAQSISGSLFGADQGAGKEEETSDKKRERVLPKLTETFMPTPS